MGFAEQALRDRWGWGWGWGEGLGLGLSATAHGIFFTARIPLEKEAFVFLGGWLHSHFGENI